MHYGKFYEQTDGAAMDSPLLPIRVNLCMEHLEKVGLETVELKPTLWLYYVDDVWMVQPHGVEILGVF